MFNKVDWIMVSIVSFIVGLIVGVAIMSVTTPAYETEPFIGESILGENPSYDSNISTESQMSAYEALLFIDDIIFPHQYYIDNPKDQNYATGNTDFNQKIVKQYQRLRSLIERLK